MSLFTYLFSISYFSALTLSYLEAIFSTSGIQLVRFAYISFGTFSTLV